MILFALTGKLGTSDRFCRWKRKKLFVTPCVGEVPLCQKLFFWCGGVRRRSLHAFLCTGIIGLAVDGWTQMERRTDVVQTKAVVIKSRIEIFGKYSLLLSYPTTQQWILSHYWVVTCAFLLQSKSVMSQPKSTISICNTPSIFLSSCSPSKADKIFEFPYPYWAKLCSESRREIISVNKQIQGGYCL